MCLCQLCGTHWILQICIQYISVFGCIALVLCAYVTMVIHKYVQIQAEQLGIYSTTHDYQGNLLASIATCANTNQYVPVCIGTWYWYVLARVELLFCRGILACQELPLHNSVGWPGQQHQWYHVLVVRKFLGVLWQPNFPRLREFPERKLGGIVLHSQLKHFGCQQELFVQRLCWFWSRTEPWRP